MVKSRGQCESLMCTVYNEDLLGRRQRMIPYVTEFDENDIRTILSLIKTTGPSAARMWEARESLCGSPPL